MLKNIGKIKQWTGERLGAAKTTNQTEDFRELESQTETKRTGFEKVYQAADLILMQLTKQKVSPEDGKTKITPIAALGKCWCSYGSDIGRNTDFGTALIELGSAEIQISQLLNTFSMFIKEDYVKTLEAIAQDYKEYNALRKKLESRRLDYDAKLSRQQKAKKEKPELDLETHAARIKYEETENELFQKMTYLKENESSHYEALRRFLEAQHHFYTEALQQLTAVLDIWPDNNGVKSSFRDNTRSSLNTKSQSFDTNMSTTSVQDRSNDDCFQHASAQNDAFVRSPGQTGSFPRRASARQGSLDNQSTAPRGRTPSAPSLYSTTSDFSSSPIRLPPIAPRRQSTSIVTTKKYRRALFDFKGESADDLSFCTGDVITVIEEVDEGWWKGEMDHHGSKRTGIFPVNYTEELVQTPSSPTHSSPRVSMSKNPRPIFEHLDEEREPIVSPFDDNAASPSVTASSSYSFETRNTKRQSFSTNVRPAPPPPNAIPSPPHSRSSAYVSLDTQPIDSATNVPPLSPPSPRVSTNFPVSKFPPRQAPQPPQPRGVPLATQPSNSTKPPCQECGCNDFSANVFKKGRCQNCFHEH